MDTAYFNLERTKKSKLHIISFLVILKPEVISFASNCFSLLRLTAKAQPAIILVYAMQNQSSNNSCV
jgi:hypothetical protein